MVTRWSDWYLASVCLSCMQADLLTIFEKDKVSDWAGWCAAEWAEILAIFTIVPLWSSQCYSFTNSTTSFYGDKTDFTRYFNSVLHFDIPSMLGHAWLCVILLLVSFLLRHTLPNHIWWIERGSLLIHHFFS